MTYQQLLQQYQTENPGTTPTGDAFNAWVTQRTGTGNWESIPDDFFQTNPTPVTGSTPASPSAAPELPGLPPVDTKGGNYGTSQVGGQTGSYDSTGQTNQTQTGEQTQTTQGTQSTTGASTSTTGVNAPFDIGALVNNQLGTSGTRDADVGSFLTDFMQTGGTGFNSQVDQAVRNSLTGPQMSGAGDSARARAAGYAGAEVARNNAGQRLQAAGQLTGPTATGQALQSTMPLYGTTQSNTNTGSTSTSGSSSTLDLQSLVSNESNKGTAAGQSSQQAGGLVPEGQPVKTGGCIVTTAYVARGEMHPGAIRRAARFKRDNWHVWGTSLDGYLLYGPFIARAVLRSAWFARNFKPLARAILYEEVRLSAPTRLKRRVLPLLAHAVFHYGSWPVGAVARLVGKAHGITSSDMLTLLRDQKLLFTR